MLKKIFVIKDNKVDYYRPKFSIMWQHFWVIKYEKWKVYIKSKKYNKRIIIGLFGILIEFTFYGEETE